MAKVSLDKLGLFEYFRPTNQSVIMETKRTKILKTALSLFVTNGFESTATACISAKAKVATGTLFHHFKSKDDLINALYYEIKASMKDRLDIDSINFTDWKKGFYEMWKVFMQWTLDNPKEVEFLLMYEESPYITPKTKEDSELLFQDAIAVLADGIKKGVFLEMPLELLLSIIQKHMSALARYIIVHPEIFKNSRKRKVLFTSYWGAIAKQV